MIIKQKKIIPLPYPVYFLPVIIITLIGLADAIYLSLSHYRVYTDIAYKSFCAISKAINCDSVSQSPYSVLLGLPVAIWGILGYSFFMISLIPAGRKSADKKRIWPVLFIVAILFDIYSIYLAVVSTFIIKSYCIMCMVLYVVNFSLTFYIWVIRKRFDGTSLLNGIKEDLNFIWSRKRVYLIFYGSFTVLVSFLWVFFPPYWEFIPPLFPQNISTGVTSNGDHWIGAENPKFEIIEFADYKCFQCRKMHFYLREIVNSHPDEIRLIHRHFPMDHRFNPIVKQPFHIGSGVLSLLAISAGDRHAFWKMNDILFRIRGASVNIEKLAGQAGLDAERVLSDMNSKKVRGKLINDIKAGIASGVTGTPSYIINGRLYRGGIPSEVLKGVLQ